MCGSMVGIQCPTVEIRRGKTKKKPQGKNIMFASATQGGHNTFIAYFTVVTGIAKAGGVAGRISANRPRIFFWNIMPLFGILYHKTGELEPCKDV